MEPAILMMANPPSQTDPTTIETYDVLDMRLQSIDMTTHEFYEWNPTTSDHQPQFYRNVMDAKRFVESQMLSGIYG